ncbi:MAG TPA: protein-L-isoaspartate(D-aspartate) O-methyltransferase [Cyclobacteriaceae bacterium]
MEDTYLHKGLRRKLVKKISEKGIKDQRVLEAIQKIPRHFFFDNAFLNHAYEDKAFPIGEGQTISQPFTVAYQTELLEIKKGDKILEIGTGSGYQACVLLELGAKVYTIEINKHLYKKAKSFLPLMGYRPYFFYGDGSIGLASYAPYDGIIVTAGAPAVPEELVAQLTINGKLVIPIGMGKNQVMYRYILKSPNEIIKEAHNNFSFVPLLGQKGQSK